MKFSLKKAEANTEPKDKNIDNLADEKDKKGKVQRRFRKKIIAINVVNVILVIASIYYLRKMPNQAEKVKELRSAKLATEESSDVVILESDIEKNKEKIEIIEKVFVNDEGFLELLTSIDQLKLEGTVTDFSFPVTRPIADSTKNIGLPMSLTFRGNLEQINNGLAKVLSLPFLIRPVNVEVATPENSESLTVKFGGFLYTNENFNKN